MADLTKEEINTLKEKFVRDFCKKKGWNKEELTTGQMMIIVKQDDYKNPKRKTIK